MTIDTGEPYVPAFFDPLSTDALTAIICEMFERQPLISLGSKPPIFDGAGLYAIYYLGGSVEQYEPLVGTGIPVYAGQGASHNSATGKAAKAPRPVYGRLSNHRRSIVEGGLNGGAFGFRVLLMPHVHANLGEDGLRRSYQPVWNSVLTGFGGNEQGGRRRSEKSRWDTFHQGRKRTHGGETHQIDELTALVEAHIEQQLLWASDLPWRKPAGEIDRP